MGSVVGREGEVGSVEDVDVGAAEDEEGGGEGEGGDVKRACQAGRSVAAMMNNMIVVLCSMVWWGEISSVRLGRLGSEWETKIGRGDI